MSESSPPASPNLSGTMIICPTTHNDWDWQVTFETYYSDGTTGGSNGPTQSVRNILDNVATILDGGDPHSADFKFSYAEVGYLRRYLADNPGAAAIFRDAGRLRFCLLGGGITSPDNQVCQGEVFIRNYLTGHEYLREMRLDRNVFFVAWLPDDFGHNPQLPVLIEAMGMSSIGLSRIPGSPQPPPCPRWQHTASEVRERGLSFYWPGRDGSKVLTHYMPETYYGLTNYGTSDTQSDMTSFLGDNNPNETPGSDKYVVWPGGTVFATQGGDWQYPVIASQSSFNGQYDWASAIGATVTAGTDTSAITMTSRLGTFADYHDALMAARDEIPSFELHAENYWTGYFASRPQLKIDHYAAARMLMGAEVLEAILATRGDTTAAEREQMARAIFEGWRLLVPTSHHDYITGTSPDSMYRIEATGQAGWDSNGQLPMVARARLLALEAIERGMAQLAHVADPASSRGSEIPIVVFNQLGRDLPDTAIVEMENPGHGVTTDYRVRVGDHVGPVQRTAENRLLFQVPGMKSMAYQVVHLVPLDAITAPPAPVDAGSSYTLDNGLVSLELGQQEAWAITGMTIGGNQYVSPNSDGANRIGLWTDSGNLYQFGMEFLNTCVQETFAFSGYMTGGKGYVVESGPIRWRFLGHMSCEVGGNTYDYTTQYELIRGETLVRIATEGQAPPAPPPPPGKSQAGWSVLAGFPMQTPAGGTAGVMEYGTSYSWENRNPRQSWQTTPITFRASHDFAQLATGTVDALGNAHPVDAIAAVYHNGMPAWTIQGSLLYGCLFRNAPGTQRGANGTDTDRHVQSYTLDVQSQLAVTGYPLRTSLYAHTPLRAKPVETESRRTAPPWAQLAGVAQADALIHVAKMTTSIEDGHNLILRIQRSGTGTEVLEVDLPFLASGGTIVHPSIVTALETVPEHPPTVTLSGTTASFEANRALWTMKVPVTLKDTR